MCCQLGELVLTDLLGQLDLDPRESIMDHRERRPEDGVGADRGEPEPQRPDLAGGGPAGRFRCRLDQREHPAGVVEEGGAGRRQPDTAITLQQTDTQDPFQALDLPAERRLGHLQPGRGPAEVQLLGDGDEPAELGQRVVHAATVSRDTESGLDGYRNRGLRLLG